MKHNPPDGRERQRNSRKNKGTGFLSHSSFPARLPGASVNHLHFFFSLSSQLYCRFHQLSSVCPCSKWGIRSFLQHFPESDEVTGRRTFQTSCFLYTFSNTQPALAFASSWVWNGFLCLLYLQNSSSADKYIISSVTWSQAPFFPGIPAEWVHPLCCYTSLHRSNYSVCHIMSLYCTRCLQVCLPVLDLDCLRLA